jgi:ubiquinone/menaquinone biosynthesis C-methylase UbiE
MASMIVQGTVQPLLTTIQMVSTGKRDFRSKSWDGVAEWYAGWSGPEGSRHHREVGIPALCDLLAPHRGEEIIDIGCGAGALARSIIAVGAHYTGIDLSTRLIDVARKHHKGSKFYSGDATRLQAVPGIRPGFFHGAAFLLSIQDISPLDDAIASAAYVLRPMGRLVILMTHPCFRIPRQSGWGWDDGRQLRFRRVDRYLTSLDVPMQEYGGKRKGITRSYHRPLQDYFEALLKAGFVIERLRELPAPPPPAGSQERRADRLAREEIPMFLGFRARLLHPRGDQPARAVDDAGDGDRTPPSKGHASRHSCAATAAGRNSFERAWAG